MCSISREVGEYLRTVPSKIHLWHVGLQLDKKNILKDVL